VAPDINDFTYLLNTVSRWRGGVGETWRSSELLGTAPACFGESTSRHRDGRHRRAERRRKVVLNAAEDDDVEEQAPSTEAAAAEDEAPQAEPAEDALPAGTLAIVPELPGPVTMGLADNYDSMVDAEKLCFESFIGSRMDNSLVN